MNLYKNKYRIKSTRLPEYNYENNGYYFVTICTKNKVNWFGRVTKNETELNDVGKIVDRCWKCLPNKFMNVSIDEYIIMPNHFHGILRIDNTRRDAINRNTLEDRDAINRNTLEDRDAINRNTFEDRDAINRNTFEDRDAINRVSTGDGGITGKNNPMNSVNSLGKIIRYFKAKCTKNIRSNNSKFAWQSRYYDKIVWDEFMLNNIQSYIRTNPERWKKDKKYLL